MAPSDPSAPGRSMPSDQQMADTRMLPPLSSLSDRNQLKLTPRVGVIAEEVASAGFDVGWDDAAAGGLAVSPVGRVRRTTGGPDLYSSLPNLQQTDPWPGGKRAKTPSFLTFAPKAAQRPATSNAALGRCADHELQRDASPMRPSTSMQRPQTDFRAGGVGGMGTSTVRRFTRLSRSVDFGVEQPFSGASTSASLAALNAAVAHRNKGAIPAANLNALTEPSYSAPEPEGADAWAAGAPADPEAAWAAAAAEASSSLAETAMHDAVGVSSSVGDAGAAAAPTGLPPPRGGPKAAAAPTSRLKTPAVQNMVLAGPTSAANSPPRGTAGGRGGEAQTLSVGASTRSSSVPFKRTTRTHPMSGFRPSRAQSLTVFYHLDHDNNGKVTLSELEEACVALGFNSEQSRRLFDKLDKQRKGYVNFVDWGGLDLNHVIEMFTLLYMRKFMGLPDTAASDEQVRRYFRNQELRKVKNLPAAINLVRVNAVSRGVRASNNATGNVIYEAFSYLDTDKSGVLSRNELRDGFGVLGVNLAETVVDEVMDLFDTNRSGQIEYYEFVKTLFPKSLR